MIRSLAGAALGAALLIAALLIPGGPTPPAAAQQPASKPLSAELTYIPADAALFLHLDATQVWSGPILKSLAQADPKLLEEANATVEGLFGSKPETLNSLTMFWPKFKGPRDSESFGVVAVFNKPFDKTKLEGGLAKITSTRQKVTLEKVSDHLAVILIGLDAEYAKPQPSKGGPQTAAIREAASRKHLLSVGIAPLQFPDEIRTDDLPAEARAFQPLFFAESIGGFITLDKNLTVDIRVKASTPPRAKEAEKSLGFLATMAGDVLGQGLKDLRKDAVTDPDARNLIAMLAALQTGVKDAKFTTEGETTRVTATTSADLQLGSAFLAAKKKMQAAASAAQSSNNLKQIGLAFHNYESANQSFPPAAVCDKTGKPILSWRVLILPYIEEEALYKQFKLDEPWDGPNNKKLIAKMPKVYALPGGASKAKADETHYRLFVGNGAGHDYLKGARIADFTDGTSNTILALTAKDPVVWSKPDELAFDPEKDMTKLLGAFFNDRCMVAYADGSVRSLKPTIAKATLHAMITRGGGEVIGDDE